MRKCRRFPEDKIVSFYHILIQILFPADNCPRGLVGRHHQHFRNLDMLGTRGTAGRIFSALAHANINVKMIDQGSSELNIIIGVSDGDFENAIRAIYNMFVLVQL